MIYLTGDHPCEKCVIIHSNWIVGGEAKTYRFKEDSLWRVDTNKYYSDITAKYLTYNNLIGVKSTVQEELHSLKTALIISELLNRILILPDFTCKGCSSGSCKTPKNRCSFLSHGEIAVLDKYFGGSYREHAFFDNPLVPEEIKMSNSRPIQFTTTNKTVSSDPPEVVQFFKNTDEVLPDDILAYFGSSTDSVLVFHDLRGNFKNLHDYVGSDLRNKVNAGVQPCDYRQYCTMNKARKKKN